MRVSDVVAYLDSLYLERLQSACSYQANNVRYHASHSYQKDAEPDEPVAEHVIIDPQRVGLRFG